MFRKPTKLSLRALISALSSSEAPNWVKSPIVGRAAPLLVGILGKKVRLTRNQSRTLKMKDRLSRLFRAALELIFEFVERKRNENGGGWLMN